MSGKRIVEELLCKHGEAVAHEWKYRHDCPGNDDGACIAVEPCRGGSRRVLTEGQYVLIEKVDGEWPTRFATNLQTIWDRGFSRMLWDPSWVQDFMDDLALSDHTEGET